MIKAEKEYAELYGDIPRGAIGRLDYLLGKIRSSRSVRGKLISEIDRIRSIKWNDFTYTIYLLPKGCPRPRESKGHFYVKGAADNKRLFEAFAEDQEDIILINTPCKFSMISYAPIPKSMKMSEKILAELGFIYNISTPDFDNLAKTYADMVKGILLYDDAIIVDGHVQKYYSVKPRVEIRVSYMEDFDCDYNRKKIMNKL